MPTFAFQQNTSLNYMSNQKINNKMSKISFLYSLHIQKLRKLFDIFRSLISCNLYKPKNIFKKLKNLSNEFQKYSLTHSHIQMKLKPLYFLMDKSDYYYLNFFKLKLFSRVFCNKNKIFSSNTLFIFIILSIFYLTNNFTVYHFNKKVHNKNKGNISFLILIFFVSTFQTYDDTTQTFTITQTSEFTEDYKNITKHVIIKEVEEIKEKAFYEWTELSSAQIGDSVKTILEEAFCSCYNLETIELGSNLEKISNSAFSSCSKLGNIKLGSNLRTISETAFSSCNSLINITIPKSVITIGDNVFLLCENLETVIFEEGLTIIGPLMFQSCNQLKYINIPSSISTIGVNPFHKCENLQFIKVSTENLYFCNYYNDGVLYDKNITKLISYPIGNSTRTFHIPISITSIEGYSFELCPYLETIFIGEKVRTIDIYAFRLCSSLQCIYYYGETPPTIPENRFHDPFDKVLATTVMTKETYSSDTFAYLNVTKGTTNDECLPWPTQTFSQSNTFSKSNSFTQSNTFSHSNTFTESNTYSNTFSKSNSFTQSNTYTQSNTFSKINLFTQSNTYTQSNTFSKSNTFTQSNTYSNTFSNSNSFTQSDTFTQSNSFTNSLPNDVTFSHSFVLMNSYSVTQTVSFYTIHIIQSLYNSYQTNIISYEYTVIYYTSLYQHYSDFYIMFTPNHENNESLSTNALIGIICGAVVAVLLIIGIICFVIKHQKLSKTKTHSNQEEQKTSVDMKFEDFNQNIGENILEDNDQWI